MAARCAAGVDVQEPRLGRAKPIRSIPSMASRALPNGTIVAVLAVVNAAAEFIDLSTVRLVAGVRLQRQT